MPLSPDSSRATYPEPEPSRATYPEPEPHGTFGLATKAPGCRMYPQPVSVRFELSEYKPIDETMTHLPPNSPHVKTVSFLSDVL